MQFISRSVVLFALAAAACGNDAAPATKPTGNAGTDSHAGNAGTASGGNASTAAAGNASAAAGKASAAAGQPSAASAGRNGAAGAAGNAGTAAATGSAGTNPVKPGDDGWKTLIEADWELAPNSEGYYCARKTLTEDMAVNAFRAISPLGTHHTLVTVATAATNMPDGVTKCSAGTNADVMITGSGVGTQPIEYPKGIAFKLKAGQQLVLNLHLFNTSSATLKGHSGTQVRTLPESEVEQIADLILAGPVMLDIPVGMATQSGKCTLSQDATVFVVSPHMHQLGVHLKATAQSSVAGARVLYDGPYDFNEQLFQEIEPLQLKRGDQVTVECTYNNTTDKTVKFGNSSLQEMCFAGLVRYPAGPGGNFVCAQ